MKKYTMKRPNSTHFLFFYQCCERDTDIYSILDRNIYLRLLKVIDRLKWKAINSSSYGRFN